MKEYKDDSTTICDRSKNHEKLKPEMLPIFGLLL